MISIRLASSEDLKLLPEIEREAARLFPPGRLPDPEKTHEVPVFEAGLQEGLLFVADEGRCVAGFALASDTESTLHLDEMDVHPDFGRRGIGRALIERVVDEAQSRSKKAVTLTTFLDLPWNAPFYEKSGFEVLEGAQISSHLKSLLRQEEQAGLSQRVAMRKTL